MFYSLTSLEVCEDSSIISAGFGDSKIKIWTLTPNRLRSMKPLDELNIIDKEAGKISNNTETNEFYLWFHSQ